MKISIILLCCFLLTGCPAVMKGMVKNNTQDSVFHLTDWKHFEEPIPKGEKRKVMLAYPTACIEFIIATKSRYFVVPEPPANSKLSGYWHDTYAVEISESGIYYVADNKLSVQFKEVSQCST